jgi:hypothetical protein
MTNKFDVAFPACRPLGIDTEHGRKTRITILKRSPEQRFLAISF